MKIAEKNMTVLMVLEGFVQIIAGAVTMEKNENI